MEFSRQEYWSGLPFPPLGDLPIPGNEPGSPALQANSLLTGMKEAHDPISLVQFSHSVVSDSLRPREQQHAWPPCTSLTPGVYPKSCPLSWWCHLTMSSSVVPFSSCLQSSPTSGSFQMNQLIASGGQWMLAIWFLVPLPFLNPVCSSGISWFTYCWSLAWRLFSITLLACEMIAIVH